MTTYKYLAFNKPYEVLCQFTDVAGRVTLKDYIDITGVYAAGRLDYRSEGLLLLTDDGRLMQRLTDPRFDHPKTYLAQVEGIVTDLAIEQLKETLLLPGLQRRLPSAVQRIADPGLPPRPVAVRNYHPTSWLKIILLEGKKHEVRRLTAAVGFPTLRLVRQAIGSITLGQLQPGQYRHLTSTEIKTINGYGA